MHMVHSKVIKRLIHIFKEKKVVIEELITILRFDQYAICILMSEHGELLHSVDVMPGFQRFICESHIT